MQFESHVKQIIQRTPDVMSFRFDRPAGFGFLPGQYMFITLDSNGKELTKHFTISSSPTEQDHLELTKKLTGHEYSNVLAGLEVGDRVLIKAPFGDFTFKGEYGKIALISGGIGVTPLRSIIKYSTDKHLGSRITLLYASRSENDIVFREEFDRMRGENENLSIIYVLSEPGERWQGIKGRINREIIENKIPDYKECIFYISGPKKMVDTMVDILKKEMKVPADKIKLDYFPGY